MADQVLVQGAAQIAHAKGAGKLAAAKAWTTIGEELSDKLSPIVQARHKSWGKYAALKLSQEGLDDEEWNSLYKELEQKRGQYIWGNARGRAEMLRDVDFLASQVTSNSGFLNNVADAGSDGNDEGFGDEFKNSALGGEYLKMLNGNLKPVTGEDGKTLGYEIDSGIYDGKDASGTLQWYSLDELNGNVDKYTYDTVSQGLMEDMMGSLQTELKNQQPGEETDFNYWHRFQTIKDNIIEDGKLESLTKNKHIKGPGTFYNHLQEFLQTGTYTMDPDDPNSFKMSLGIKSDDYEDPTPETEVTASDAKLIADKLIEDETMLKDYLARYYTNYMEQNWRRAAGDKDDDGDGTINSKDEDYVHGKTIYGGEWGSVKGNIERTEEMIKDRGGYLIHDESGRKVWSPFGTSGFPETTSDITKRDEGKAIKMLEDQYPFDQYGFKFEGTGTARHDKITITAPNGKSKEFHIDAPYKLNPLAKPGEYGGRGLKEDERTATAITLWMQENLN